MNEDLDLYYLERNWKEWYLAIQGFFYFAQGVAFAAIILLPVFMQRVMGIPASTSLVYNAIIMIPWYIKLIYGMLSDNVAIGKYGRRKPYMFIAAALGIVGWLLLPTFTDFSPFFILVGMSLSLCVALSDAIIDSLAVDVTPQRRRGFMQGVGWGGRGAGMLVSGVTLGMLIDSIGWAVAYIFPGILVILACFVAFLYKEPPELEKKEIVFEKLAYKKAFGSSTLWIVSVFMIFSGAGLTIISVFSTFVNVETGLDIETIGIGITLFALGQIIGAIIMGISGDLLPLYPVFLGATLLYNLVIIWLYFLDLHNLLLLYIYIVVIGAINGGYEANQMRLAMEHSAGKIGGTLYNWFMSLSNVGQVALGAVIIGIIADTAGYKVAMQFVHIFLIVALIPAWFIVKRIVKVEKLVRVD